MTFIRRNFDDTPVREFGIKFTKEKFGLIFENHPNRTAIDLIDPINYNIGAEMEGGGWEGDFWSNEKYSLISKLNFKTINIPIRKTKYWYDKINELFLPNKKKNLFIRTNKNFTQAIVIKPTTIKNKNKILWTEFQPSNSIEVEKWMSFRQEHVDTYDLVKDKWKLQRTKKKNGI
jgi:hypothetical protein